MHKLVLIRHGESLWNRLERELESVRKWPGIGTDRVDVIRDAIGQPELSRVRLQEVSPVLGHGDYQACNVLCTPEGVIAPIDWIDSGLCDPPVGQAGSNRFQLLAGGFQERQNRQQSIVLQGKVLLQRFPG